MVNHKKKALFLDRDGVINKSYIHNGQPHSPCHVEEFIVLNDVKDALILSKKMGFLNIIVTNQPNVARGNHSLETMEQMHEIIKSNLVIDDIFVCLHLDEDECQCRKPLPGMLLSAKIKWDLDFTKSFLVGDRWRDIEAAQAIGCESFWIDYGYNEKQPLPPYHKVGSLKEAVEKIRKLSSSRLLK